MYITVSPAYGRDYKSKKEALEDWNSGKDFKIESITHGAGSYINKDDAPDGSTIMIRYDNLKKVFPIKIDKSNQNTKKTKKL